MADLHRHRADTERAIVEGGAARDDVFNHLMRLAPEERAKMPPALFARLTETQLRALMGGAVEIRPVAPANMIVAPSVLKPGKRGKFVTAAPPIFSALRGAAIVTVLGAIAVLPVSALGSRIATAGSMLSRPASVDTWPNCPRLDQVVDGCLYRVERGISLETAGAALGLSPQILLTTNTEFASNSVILPAGTPIIIWRGRGKLTQ